MENVASVKLETEIFILRSVCMWGGLQGYRQRSGHVLAFVISQLSIDLVVFIFALTSNHPFPYLPSILTLHVFSPGHPFPFPPSISRFISPFLICPSSLSSFNFVFRLLLLLAIFFFSLSYSIRKPLGLAGFIGCMGDV